MSSCLGSAATGASTGAGVVATGSVVRIAERLWVAAAGVFGFADAGVERFFFTSADGAVSTFTSAVLRLGMLDFITRQTFVLELVVAIWFWVAL